ncbi:MAG: hypothetical protein UU71_C0040G0002 [Parcubacteria group bacterium GW2011_GWB1_41_6]|nr:MAG: hypothetical protein UU71_C0040G0002 [Parcubacteria group bacterium GW2011_GWB1_41_6]KKS56893.1 MAG: hypothetical protein UV22_C0024G0008 [Parcubacteria group bacterium GW2011_GWA2_42_35]KKS70420.1 MAG: hypothetical protein UV43_C0064G0006 [Parcubacteria group bacterium GW2011_GWF2_42_7]
MLFLNFGARALSRPAFFITRLLNASRLIDQASPCSIDNKLIIKFNILRLNSIFKVLSFLGFHLFCIQRTTTHRNFNF